MAPISPYLIRRAEARARAEARGKVIFSMVLAALALAWWMGAL